MTSLRRTTRVKEGSKMKWGRAYAWAAAIFIIIVLTTTWFPSWLLARNAVATAERWVADLIGSGVWFIALAGCLFGLRWLQKTDRI